ncbi:MAG: deoxyguanosinetriphosphate triphosphohydrolase [Planctomycetes bacterium]|nr:deoxyguanosinetriphosphate triphosphohydrolase [Planctomycetota bacterium]
MKTNWSFCDGSIMSAPVLLDPYKLSTREFLEAQEKETLAPYAICALDSKGRKYDEPLHPIRTAFQRDRDRVVYSTAFRRLEYKTQVFPNHEGDHYRTRLTHTIEVANLTRTLARNLRLNEDFSECLALVHDIGHPPFGHCGEEILADLMKPYGGFEHNEQTLRIVTALENSYTSYQGLNLSLEINEAILQHTKNFRRRYPDTNPALLETQLVSLTDEMVYNSHDLEDGLASGILNEADVLDLEIMQGIASNPDFPHRSRITLRRRYLVRQVLNSMVLDFMETTQAELASLKLTCLDDVLALKKSPLIFSEKMDRMKNQIEYFLREKMYQHPKVMKMMNKSKYFMDRIFEHFLLYPSELPVEFQERMEKDGKERSISDYIAGMTDRYLQEEYIRLFVPFQKML